MKIAKRKGKSSGVPEPPGKTTKTGYSDFFNTPSRWASPKGEITRDDYNAWKKAWFDDGVKWGTTIGPGADQFWGDRMNEVKSTFDNDETVFSVKYGDFDPEFIPKDVANRNGYTKKNNLVYEMKHRDKMPEVQIVEAAAKPVSKGPKITFTDLQGNPTSHENMGRLVYSRPVKK